MAIRSSKIIRRIFLSSLASIIGATGRAESNGSASTLNPLSGFGPQDKEVKAKQKIYKNLYKLKKDGDWQLIAGHRSHSSHSSHSSHRSGSGGHYSHSSHTSSSGHYSSYGTSTSSSSRSSSSTTSKSTTSKKSSIYTSKPAVPVKTYKDYKLGERTIYRGIYGSDVDALVAKLASKGYLKGTNVTQTKGYATVDTEVHNAICHFQKDAGLPQSGQVTKATATTLDEWDPEKTTIILGFRNLSVGMSGHDVTELVVLLQKAGYPPDPTKLESNGYGFYKFTSDVEIAVNMFKAYNSLPLNGKVTESLIGLLKKAAK